MASEAIIKRVNTVAGGLLIEFRDGRAAFYPSSFLSTYQPWFELDVPGNDEIDFLTPPTVLDN